MLTKHLKFSSAELQNFNWIFKSGPCFPMNSSRVKIYMEPSNFYDALKTQFSSAKHRIYIASLYIGTGEKEKKLLSTVENCIKINENTKFNVLVDYQRGTRGSENSHTLLHDFVVKHFDRCNVALYQTPKMSGVLGLALPTRYNEIVGLQHMKIYIADDVVILSGANCSEEYFANRQDRYIQMEDKDIADFYSELIDEVSGLSRVITLDQEYSTKLRSPNHGGPVEFTTFSSNRIIDFIGSWTYKQRKIMKSLAGIMLGEDTLVFPLIQMGQLGIRQDEQTTLSIMSAAPSNSKLRIATGYFNLTENYQQVLLHECEALVTLLMAHPMANGFRNASGVASGIPDAYSFLAQKFMKKVKKFEQSQRIHVYEYNRPLWTFHAKGLWYYPPNCAHPWMTLIGSANLGERSVKRDLEAQAAIFTVAPTLQEQLHAECDKLYAFSSECSTELLNRKTPLWVQSAVNVFKKYF